MKLVVGPLRSTFAALERRKKRLIGTADAAIAEMAIVIEVRDLIVAVFALLGPVVAQSTIPMRPIAARPLRSESVIIESRTWPRASWPTVNRAIRITSLLETVIVTGNGTGTLSGTGNLAGIAILVETATDETATATATGNGIEITTAAPAGMTSSTTTIERGELERRTGRGYIAGEWTATLTNSLMVTRGLVRLVVVGLMMMSSIVETREIRR
jgi:hypothetical protein